MLLPNFRGPVRGLESHGLLSLAVMRMIMICLTRMILVMPFSFSPRLFSFSEISLCWLGLLLGWLRVGLRTCTIPRPPYLPLSSCTSLPSIFPGLLTVSEWIFVPRINGLLWSALPRHPYWSHNGRSGGLIWEWLHAGLIPMADLPPNKR